jgi:hypothetical protein
MNEDTKLSDLSVAEFRKLMQECLQRDMDAGNEVERLRQAFIDARSSDNNLPSDYVRHAYQPQRQSWGWPFDMFGG